MLNPIFVDVVNAVAGFALGTVYGSRIKSELLAVESRIVIAIKAEIASLKADAAKEVTAVIAKV